MQVYTETRAHSNTAYAKIFHHEHRVRQLDKLRHYIHLYEYSKLVEFRNLFGVRKSFRSRRYPDKGIV